MLKRKYSFFYKNIPVPSLFVVEGYQMFRFKTKEELKHDFVYYVKKLVAKLKKQSITNNGSGWYNIKSLSSFDYEIDKKGGIVDCNGNVHTTAQSYKNFLKDNDLVIKDWSDGSNKRQMQLSDRADIAKQLNKYI
jgi:hypothetical protein